MTFAALLSTTILSSFVALNSLFGGVAASPTNWKDLSWPNCQAAPKNLSYGIVGVTGGLNFHKNPCLKTEADLFSNYQLYVNTGYPGKSYALKYAHSPLNCSLSDENCLAYDFGYAAGLYALKYAASQTVQSSMWWLDVETENSWSDNVASNQEAIFGTWTAILSHSFAARVGFYSYPDQWQEIVGGWRPVAPAWLATGSSSIKIAAKACKAPSFTDGPVIFGQYTTKLDQDVNCLRY